ncbi:hypothetical protein [Candidatus Uabimicrobium amorphum]|uniref:Uncharacterized protein n=1 Tax=Uabimicrobium amorphum TaxID=2596890 RepID=A0A5S9IPU0_UABAM|nr:hypothetical protein [Candidatus Uabimicrobium amorphum]BBM85674.1 hypothetical protein UABAM_04048 [Candidatus Uabimicrobium amorphum]
MLRAKHFHQNFSLDSLQSRAILSLLDKLEAINEILDCKEQQSKS